MPQPCPPCSSHTDYFPLFQQARLILASESGPLASPLAWNVLHLLFLSNLETLSSIFTSSEFQFLPGLSGWDLRTIGSEGNV